MYMGDKKGKVPHPQGILSDFRKTIEDCQLAEIDLNGGRFTWEKSRGCEN